MTKPQPNEAMSLVLAYFPNFLSPEAKKQFSAIPMKRIRKTNEVNRDPFDADYRKALVELDKFLKEGR